MEEVSYEKEHYFMTGGFGGSYAGKRVGVALNGVISRYNDELARLKKEYGENAKGTVSYQQIQSDLAAGTKAPSSGSTLDIQI